MDWAISLASPSAPPSFAPRPSAPRLAAPVAPVSARRRDRACCAGLLVAAACRQRRDRVARRADVKITDATGEKRVPGEKGEKHGKAAGEVERMILYILILDDPYSLGQ